jgi:hypothetical protein
MRKWIAIDQFGHHEFFPGKTPRKALLERMGRKSARKIYRDNADRTASRHVGWIIGGLWFEVYLLTPLAEVK